MMLRLSGRLASVSLVPCLLLPILALYPDRAASAPVLVPADIAASLDVPHVPGQFIVKFRDDVDEEARKDALATGEALELDDYAEIDAKLAETSPENLAFVLAELSLDPRVEYAEPNFLLAFEQIPNDPQYPLQWGLNNSGQGAGEQAGIADADINAPEAWDITTGSPDVIVAVIDSGVDFTHSDLGGSDRDNSAMWTNPGELCPGCSTDGMDNDGNGYIDDWRGWDFANIDNSPRDDNGHGTHVAGIIGARSNNGEGGAGISWNTTIMALKTFGSGGAGATGASVAGTLYAANAGADIINASWGAIQPSLALEEAIVYAGEQGVLFVAAGGNDGLNTDLIGHFPSALDVNTLISVGATTNRDELAEFSNYGLKTVDIGAPGQDVYSTWVPEGLTSSYRYASGTSMAAPHVSGVAALIKARFPEATPLGIKNLIFNTADTRPQLEGLVSTGARLDAFNAVSCSDEPQVWIDRPVPGFAAVPGEPLEVRVLASNCAVPEGVTVTAFAGEQVIELTAEGGGLYTGRFAPLAPGDLTITAEARLGELVDRHEVTGEGVLNYSFQNDVFDWQDATGGTQIPFGEERDFETVVPLPFPFTFYNRSFEEISVGENGLVGFGGTRVTDPFNQRIPDILAPNGFIAAFWDNLHLEAGGELWYDTLGEARNRRFVVSWIDVPNAVQVSSTIINPDPLDGITFQIILEEATNQIVIQYLDADFNLTTIDYGGSATIGVEHFSGTIGKQFSYNDASLREYEGKSALRLRLRDPAQPEILTSTLANGPVGRPYLQRLQVDGGAPPYTWSIVEGSLPDGVGLDPVTGTIAGTPHEPGSYAFTVEVTDSAGVTTRQFLDFDVVVGYAFSDDEFAWVDASDGGQQLPFERDDQAIPVELPFSFSYYGQPFESVQVSTNGYLVFGDNRATSFSNTELPNVRDPNGTVAVFWDDLSPQDAGSVWARTVGEAPNRRVVIEWLDVPRFKEHGAGTFEVILEEGSNDIVMQYLDLTFDGETYDFGASASVGLENFDGTVGTQFSNDQVIPEQYIGQTALRFTAGSPPAPVMNVETLLDGQLDQPYVDLVSAQGGTPPFTWTISGGELPPGLALDPATGMISGTPAAVGSYAFTATATDSGDPVQTVSADYTINVLPSYTISDGPYEWIDAREGGTHQEYPDDDEATIVPLPFSFTFYGEQFNDVQVSTNGYLVFGGSAAQALRNVPIPNPNEPNGLVSALWDDLDPDAGQGVWLRVVGEAPNRRVVVSWIDAARFNDVGAATFQIILEETTNRIIFQYQDVVFDDERYDYGASATIGLETPAGTLGSQFSVDTPILLPYEGQQSIVFTPVVE